LSHCFGRRRRRRWLSSLFVVVVAVCRRRLCYCVVAPLSRSCSLAAVAVVVVIVVCPVVRLFCCYICLLCKWLDTSNAAGLIRLGTVAPTQQSCDGCAFSQVQRDVRCGYHSLTTHRRRPVFPNILLGSRHNFLYLYLVIVSDVPLEHNTMQTVREQIEALRYLWSHKRQLLFQALNLGMVVLSALMIWKFLIFMTYSGSPVVVVLSGSMEPAFQRGDILFLNNQPDDPLRVRQFVAPTGRGRRFSLFEFVCVSLSLFVCAGRRNRSLQHQKP